jgi:hypothetical protein
MISYLELRETTVDGEFRAYDVGGILTEEVGNAGCDVIGSGETSERDLPQEVRRDGLLLCRYCPR